MEDLNIYVTVRRQEQADVLQKIGLNTIILDDLDNVEQLRKTAEEFDIIIHSTNGYHPASAEALIQGLGKRKTSSVGNTNVHYIHNSGTSNLGGTPTAHDSTPRVFVDSDTDLYEYEKACEAKESYPQRTTDIKVVETGISQDVRTYIVMSPLVYGTGTGLFNTSSIQVPLLIRDALRHGKAAYVGDGLNLWDHVHVTDMAAFFALLLGKVVETAPLSYGENGTYFVNAGRHSWKEIATKIAEAGYKSGKLASGQPESIGLEIASERWLGGNRQLTQFGFASQ